MDILNNYEEVCHLSKVLTQNSVSLSNLRYFQSTEKTFFPQIYLSGSASVPENQPRGTRVGSFSSTDPNSNDRHTYSIVRGGAGKFELRGANLSTLTTFDYESSPNK